MAGKGALHAHQPLPVGARPDQPEIRLVGVEDLAVGCSHHGPEGQVVYIGLGQVVAGRALAEMQDADGPREEGEDADHRHHRDRLGHQHHHDHQRGHYS